MEHTEVVEDLPECLKRTNTAQPVDQLFVRARQPGTFRDLMSRPRVAIVGSRRLSAYGQAATDKFATELAARGVVIISGLALGVDAIAHRAALRVGGLTMAVLPAAAETPYPLRHARLAQDIVASGGALVSEYPAGTPPFIHHFIERNRIVAGLANVLLITEATENSGTMHTANFAIEQGVDVLAIPGNITSPTSAGTNNLLKSRAFPATDVNDVLQALGLDLLTKDHTQRARVKGSNKEEQLIIDLLEQGISDGSQLLAASGFSVQQFNSNLTMLEITAKIRALGGNHWAIG